MSSFKLNRRQHTQGGVSALAIVENLEVLKDGVAQLDSSTPALTVQELDLHSAPKRFRHRIVVADTNRSHGWHEP